ncbi:MAG: PD-(D/E)XK nuclease family protein [Deltaproteobacteria bacterium]|nr:PD-(D/E)XK nuclease family protein [Deltaproteobacteria bacterium]
MHTKAFEKLASAISRGAFVLTVNARLTRHITSEYDNSMRRSGKTAWPTASVMPFSSWVAGFREEYSNVPALTGLRARALWERIVSSDPLVSEAWPSSGVGRASFEAYRLMSEYSISLPEDEIYLTEESKALKRWAGAYEAELKRLGFTGEAQVNEEAKRLIERGALIPGEVILAGFDELSPAASSIAAALERQGSLVSRWPDPLDLPPQAEAALVECEDELEEVVRAARWVRSVYRPGMKIGVIVPDLDRYRRSIIREFTAELSPAAVLPGASVTSSFNVSLGAPLAEEPLVGSALAIISIGASKTHLSELMSALSSPFFAGDEIKEIAKVDLRLREQNRTEASLAEFKALLGGQGPSKRLGEWLDWMKGAGKKQAPGAWAKAFTDLLGRVGWLKGRELSSREYQGLAAWNKALEGFSCLDDVLGKISRGEAASRLISIARETIHQVETPDSDIQVLGLLEATGLWFDHIRVIGCHECALPAEPSTNPFLPPGLQALRRVPHSTGEIELEFARIVSKRLLSSAPSVIVSWPRSSDGRELNVSPLFRGCVKAIEGEMPSSRLLDMDPAPLEDGLPDGPVPVSEPEKAALRGGTSILKNQSICPFRAFALHRLYAKALPSTELGLKPEARGTLLHEAMRLFWEEVRSSSALKEMKESGGLKAYVDGIATKALEGAQLPPPLSTRFVELERQRLSALLLEWVEIECARGVGFHVKTTELEKTLEIGGLVVKGKADRIDELDGGGEAVIDYKTGNPARRDWLTRRPMEPQLLVYSVDGRFDAVSFARVSTGGCKFLGITRHERTLPGIKQYDDDKFKVEAEGLDWDSLMLFWKETLETLAKDFLAGVCEVDPNNLPGDDRACRYCELGPLCRVSELGRRGGADEGDEESS